MKQIYFERAIFLSWYCSKGDCKFCYMSTQKSRIKNPRLARRTKESVLAEVLLCKILDWKIEFISGGYESYGWSELVQLIKEIKTVYGKKLWLNIGTLNENEIKDMIPYVEGISVPVECINPRIRKDVCPSKPMEDIETTLIACDKFKLEKSMTLILGLGETLSDFRYLDKFIKKYNIDQITFYRLKPQKETAFENAQPIESVYYEKWIRSTRHNFPDLKIIVGSWLTHLGEIHYLLDAGADGITKFPSVKKFNSKYAKIIQDEVKKAGLEFVSNLTKKPKIDIEEETAKLELDDRLKERIKIKLKQYLDSIH